MSSARFPLSRRYPAPTAALLLLLAGCGGGMSDLQQFVAQEKAKPPGAIEPLPQIRPYESFMYQAQELRSPFVPDASYQQAKAAEGGGTGPRPDANRNREYLEEFPLDSLKMVGTLEIRGVTYGLVKDTDGAVHRVRVGNHMGQNYGKIIEITESEIRLTEIVPDGLGGWMERQASLALVE
ncbi:MAG TPA: pilus assembly protein PilP [Gammaproteobacteria bacterium]|nr:pilus assembly protein PilP [Gammaproteobacteria bacterium]